MDCDFVDYCTQESEFYIAVLYFILLNVSIHKQSVLVCAPSEAGVEYFVKVPIFWEISQISCNLQTNIGYCDNAGGVKI